MGKNNDMCASVAGDFVDRGSWGLEVLLVLVTLKLALPQSVFLLRGNHEGKMCTKAYGFHAELIYKYKGLPKVSNKRKPAMAVYAACLGARLRLLILYGAGE
jgi:Calcineurin-like phosphoesterase